MHASLRPARQAMVFCLVAMFPSMLIAQLTSEVLEVNGQSRTFLQYLPEGFDAAEQLPLMMCFHGGSGTAEGQLYTGDLRDKADEDRFVLVYPQALPDPNDGGSTNWQVVTSGELPFTVPNPHSDIDFVSNLIDAMQLLHNVDPSRIYAMGYSNGGGFVYDLACRLNDKVTGVGAVARTMYAESYANCDVNHPTPIVTILGTNDFISSYDGITYAGTLYYHSSDAGNDLWIDLNGLQATAQVTALEDTNPVDGSTVELYQWTDDAGCRELAHYKVVGGDHDWPGSFGNMDIVSHEVIWDRLKAFNMEGRISCGTAGAEEPSLSTWRVWPNPTTDALVVDWGGFHAAEDYAVFNAAGQCVMSGTVPMGSRSLDVGQLRPGLHWIRIAGTAQAFLVE